MKKYIINFLIMLLFGQAVFSQAPNWQVNENDFQYTMSFVAFLNIDGQNLEDPNDQVAAFVNGVCRGVTDLTYVASEDRYYAYLTVFSNTNGESIQFKIYDASNDAISDIATDESFEINQHYGDLFQPYSIASPQLNNEAEILDFELDNVYMNDQVFDGNQITLYVNNGVDISNLSASFRLSTGAKLYLDRSEVLSGDTRLDFSSPVTFEVVSEDRSIIQDYTVAINVSSGDFTFYKKDAVCYAGGALKITAVRSGDEVTLLHNGVIIKSGTITNGALIFDDLETGDYTIRVAGNSKRIIINLKN
ncbi:hypothetical protein [Aquimarina brevivitae]|uniref:Secreted protein (Por secretion system target) n=1 Tax=Aquimarina brevivitae TaxID=323412 RepID=A0A4Q7NYD4_9FLAO|nr:hypothetical protein [Aquimarina brevivitae]RZS92451.1 hypothetical protein EV197_2589 [Aquimarina brevivitae]